MDTWLKETLNLVNGSQIELENVALRTFVVIFYDHLSNRNLAVLLASLFKMDENDIYFKIDKIVSDPKRNDNDEIEQVTKALNANGFQAWIDSEEF